MAIPSLFRSLLLAAPLLAGVDAAPKKPCKPQSPTTTTTADVVSTTSATVVVPSSETTVLSSTLETTTTEKHITATTLTSVIVSMSTKWPDSTEAGSTTETTTEADSTTTTAETSTSAAETTTSFITTSTSTTTTSEAPKATWTNPLFEGYYADPDVVKFGDTYWVYGTTSGGEVLDTINAWSSKDMSTWTKHEAVFKSQDSQWAKNHFWAPSVVERNGKYYLYYSANNVLAVDPAPHGMGVAVADSPSGPFKDLAESAIVDRVIDGATQIDQMVFRDDDGSWYYMFGNGACNIARLGDDMKSFGKWDDGKDWKNITPAKTAEGQYAEGSYMIKRNGWYYLMWSENPYGDPRYLVAYGMSRSILGPFERKATVLVTDGKTAQSTAHHAMLKDGDDWWIFYHGREMDDANIDHRTIRMDRLYFNDDDTIKPVVITKGGEL